MRVHLLGLPHTITTKTWSTCAFTSKVRYMSPMLRPLGYDTIHYGVAGADSGATLDVDILSQDEYYALLGHRNEDSKRFAGDDARIDSPLYAEFNRRLGPALAQYVQPGDIVFHPFGKAHYGAVDGHAGVNCEMGIGYPESFLPFRIFESSAWMHWHQAKFGRGISVYEWVIPASFDVAEWPVGTPDTERPYIAFLGRISTLKGCHLISELAKRVPHMRFVLCGNGDPAPFLTSPNIEYLPPITGTARAEFLGKAVACIYPSQYCEPFGQTHVEAMLCGTPVLVPPYGVYLETVQHGANGFHCRVLNDWVRAIQKVATINRTFVRHNAVSRYSLPVVGKLYDNAIQQLSAYGLGKDWYSFEGTL
jgi:glycosyltransferase involved in cell wall biosynthesis